MKKKLQLKIILIFLILAAATGVQAQTSQTGYIHMDPSKKGFVYDGGSKYIPIGYNNAGIWSRSWLDDPATGREYVPNLGAFDWAENTPSGCNKCSSGCTPLKFFGITFNEYFSTLKNNGVNSQRIWLGSIYWNPRINPMPIDKYHIGDQVICGDAAMARNNTGGYQDKQIDGADLIQNYPNCRWPDFSVADCGAEYSEKLNKSHITRMIRAAENNGVKIKLVLFGSSDAESGDKWALSAYNNDNCRYDEPGKCGPIENAYEFWANGNWNAPLFSENTAINHAKIYANFVMQVWGPSQAIWNWELWNEIHYSNTISGREAQMVNWVDHMSAYVKSLDSHNRPVSISAYMDESSYIPNQTYSINNIDFADYHYYAPNDRAKMENFLRIIRDMENNYSKPAFIGEFWPWGAQVNPINQNITDIYIEDTQKADPPYEVKPYRPSLIRIWVGFIASGVSASHRWSPTGLRDDSNKDLSVTDMSVIYKGISKYVDVISWDNWNYASSVSWENNISGNIDFKAARGDGDQALVLVHGINANLAIAVSNLSPGNYKVNLFDFITGDLIDSYSNVSAGSGTLSLNLNLASSHLDKSGDGYDRKQTGVLYIEKASVFPSAPSGLSVR